MANNRHGNHHRAPREFFTLGEHQIGNRLYRFKYDGKVYHITEQLQLPEQETEEKVLLEEVENILLDIERANRGLAGELKRIDMMRQYMQLRRENYQGHIGEYNFMSRIKEYNHYLTCWENYYSYQYKRDCCIAALQMYLPQQSVLDFCIINK